MKKIMLLLTICILLSTGIVASFAVSKTPGEILRSYGLLTGDYNGDLNEDQ